MEILNCIPSKLFFNSPEAEFLGQNLQELHTGAREGVHRRRVVAQVGHELKRARVGVWQKHISGQNASILFTSDFMDISRFVYSNFSMKK